MRQDRFRLRSTLILRRPRAMCLEYQRREITAMLRLNYEHSLGNEASIRQETGRFSVALRANPVRAIGEHAVPSCKGFIAMTIRICVGSFTNIVWGHEPRR
jgi:hypothetical protein